MAPVQPARAAFGFDFDGQLTVTAGNGQWLGAIAEPPADLNFVAIPAGDGHRAGDVADVDAGCWARIVAQIDRCIGKCLTDAKAQQQGGNSERISWSYS